MLPPAERFEVVLNAIVSRLGGRQGADLLSVSCPYCFLPDIVFPGTVGYEAQSPFRGSPDDGIPTAEGKIRLQLSGDEEVLYEFA